MEPASKKEPDRQFSTINARTIVSEQPVKLVNVDTGEQIVATQVYKTVYGSQQYWKCFMSDFLRVLGVVGNKQLDVLIHILDNTSPLDNTFHGTYKTIQQATGISQMTISRVMPRLQELGYVKMLHYGCWMVNPQLLVKGSEEHRKLLLVEYHRGNGQAPHPEVDE